MDTKKKIILSSFVLVIFIGVFFSIYKTNFSKNFSNKVSQDIEKKNAKIEKKKFVKENEIISEFSDIKNVMKNVSIIHLENILFENRTLLFVPEYNCYLKKIKISNKEEGDFCLNIHNVYENKENKKTFVYVSITGIPLDENLKQYISYGSYGVLKLFKFKYENKNYNLISESDYILGGNSGNAPSHVKTFEFNKKKQRGWVLNYGWMISGIIESELNIYLPKDNKIYDVFEMQLEYNNGGVCSPDEKTEQECILYDKKADVKLIKNNNKYYSIDINLTEEVNRNNKIKNNKKKVLIHFNEIYNKYIINPDELEFKNKDV